MLSVARPSISIHIGDEEEGMMQESVSPEKLAEQNIDSSEHGSDSTKANSGR